MQSLAAALLALAGSTLLFAEVRDWTSADGKSIRGEYVDTVDDSVILLVNGKEKRVKLSKLSQEDRDYVKGLQEKGSSHQVNKNFTDKWPTSTVMEDKLKAKAVKEDDKEGVYVYETAHFRFHSPARLSIQTVSEMGRVFEGTYTACRMIPLNFPCRRFNVNKDVDAEGRGDEEKMIARLFLTKADYAKEVGPSHADSAGLYRTPEILVPFDSLGIVKKGRTYSKAAGSKLSTGTLIHELTHQMSLLGATYDVPIWFAEGMAEFVHLAGYKQGRFNFKEIKKNIKPYIVGGPGTESRQLGAKFSSPALKDRLNQTTEEFQASSGSETQFNYGFSTLLVYYFVYLDGRGDGARLKRWMRDLQETKPAAASLSEMVPVDATPEQLAAVQRRLAEKAKLLKPEYHYEKLLDGRSWEELEEEFATKVKRALGIEVTFQPSAAGKSDAGSDTGSGGGFFGS